MSLLTILIIVVTVLLILAGFAGIFLPGLPDAPLILAGMLVYGIYTRFEEVGLATFVILIILTLFILVCDLAAYVLGAKKFGASWAGILGAFLGGIFGWLTGSLIGLIVGPFVGAALGEILLRRQSVKQSLKSGGGAVIGFLAGTLVKTTLVVVMIGIFLLAAIF